MKALIRVALYLRRSNKKQEKSIEDQESECRRYAAKHGYKIVAVYVDDGISGDATEDRDDFLRMREDASKGLFVAILCWDQDRFGRFDLLEAGHWIHPFRAHDVYLITVADGPIDWEDFTGRLMYALKQEGKHQFLQDLSKNTLRGKKACADKGCATSPPCYGYVNVGEKCDKKPTPGNPKEIKVVQRIFHEYVVERRSRLNIALRLNADGIPTPGIPERRAKLWTSSAIRVILRRPTYMGTFCHNVRSDGKYYHIEDGEIRRGGGRRHNPREQWTIKPNNHEAIIDEQTWNLAQAMLDECRRRPQRTRTSESNPYVLTGILKCGHCGAPMWGNSISTLSYTCSRRKQQLKAKSAGDAISDKDLCPGTDVRQAVVLAKFAEYVEDEFLPVKDQCRLQALVAGGELTMDKLPAGFQKLRRILLNDLKQQADPKRLEKQRQELIKTIEAARRNLAYIPDPTDIEVVLDEIEKMTERHKLLQQQLESQPTPQSVDEMVKSIWTALTALYDGDDDRIRAVLSYIEGITVHSQVSGTGTGTRHRFIRGQVKFRQVVAIGDVSSQSQSKSI